jgi:hypothetical protein
LKKLFDPGKYAMENKRLHLRLDCEDCCHLFMRDSLYSATVKNISLGGVLMHFHDPLPGVRVGDNCKVRLGEVLTCEYNCEVVRVETSNVALRFIDMVSENYPNGWDHHIRRYHDHQHLVLAKTERA